MSYKVASQLAELVVQNSSELSQNGGASKVSSKKSNSLDMAHDDTSYPVRVYGSANTSFATLGMGVLVWMIMILLLAWVVQSCYNYIMPRLVLSFGGQDKLQKFQELKYVDAVVLLLLAKCLF